MSASEETRYETTPKSSNKNFLSCWQTSRQNIIVWRFKEGEDGLNDFKNTLLSLGYLIYRSNDYLVFLIATRRLFATYFSIYLTALPIWFQGRNLLITVTYFWQMGCFWGNYFKWSKSCESYLFFEGIVLLY